MAGTHEHRFPASKWWGVLATAPLMVLATATGATAQETDTVTAIELGISCQTGDGIAVTATYTVESHDGTDPGDRITGITVNHDDEDNSWPMRLDFPVPGAAEFLTSGEYELTISNYVMRSTLNGDYYDVAFISADGDVVASASTQVDCFTGGDEGAAVHGFAAKARLGVPRNIRLLEHVTFGGLFDAPVTQAWVASDGRMPATGLTDDDVLDLDSGDQAALGATIASHVLNVNPTLAGTYELDWGVVTKEVEGEMRTLVDGQPGVDVTDWPLKVWVEDPQWMWIEYPQWVWDSIPDVTQNPDDLQHWFVTDPGSGHFEGGERTWIDTPQWVALTNASYGDYVWVQTGETRTSAGPASLTLEVIDGPIQPDASIIVEETRGDVSAPDTTNAGESFTLDVGDENADGWIDVWMHSDPTYLGLFPVSADGTVSLTVPSSLGAGAHRVVVTDELGNFIGWDNMNVRAGSGGNAVPRGATGLDENSLGLSALLAFGALACAVAAMTTAPRFTRT